VIDWQFLEPMMFSGKQHALKIDNHHWGQYPQLLQFIGSATIFYGFIPLEIKFPSIGEVDIFQ